MANEPTPKQQWSELIKNSQNILILPHNSPDGDAIGSSLALKMALEKLNKTATVAVSGDVAEAFSFLPHFDQLEKNFSSQKDLLIIVDESQAKIGNVSLKRVSDKKIMIVVTPKDGILTNSNIRIEDGSFPIDLIIVVDTPIEERLNPIFEANRSLFYEVPVINIDHHQDNTNYGQVNLIDLTASSVAEMMVSLIETVGKDTPGGLIDADIATCLLTGITTDTGCFQNQNTTPKSLTVSAQLVATGAKQQEIVNRLFRTKSLSTLRLWGRALAYIKEDQDFKFAWSILTRSDFVAAQAEAEEASGVIDELLKTASGMSFVLLLSERHGDIYGSLRSINPSVDVAHLAERLGGGGHAQAAAFKLDQALISEKEAEIINTIRNALKPMEKQLNTTNPKVNPADSMTKW